MRIAVKSAGGITESFLHVENAEEGLKEAAKQIAEDYGFPTDLELWSDRPGRRGATQARPAPFRGPGRPRQHRRARLTRKRTARGHPRARRAGGVKARPP